MFYLINLIDFSNYMLILNLLAAVRLKMIAFCFLKLELYVLQSLYSMYVSLFLYTV